MRSLKSKKAEKTAKELLDIFLHFGALSILQSDNGREFTATIIKEVVSMWPECKLINGRPRHPESQGSIERSNDVFKTKLFAWMSEQKSKKWSVGIKFVMFVFNLQMKRCLVKLQESGYQLILLKVY